MSGEKIEEGGHLLVKGTGLSDDTLEATSGVSGEVDSVIGNLSDLKSGQILLPGFAEIGDDGLYVNLETITSREEFIKFVNQVFQNNCYFEDLDYAIFSKLIYNLDKTKEDLGNKKIKLSTSIKRFLPERKGKYQKPTLFRKDSGEYTFSKLYDTIDTGDGKTMEVETSLSVDEFIAAMWGFGIQYGLNIPEIKDMIENKKSGRILIAKSLEYTEGIAARLLTLVNLGVDKELQMRGTRLDLQAYKRVFPQIKAGTKIYQKIDKTPGIYGMNIGGEILPPPPPEDIVFSEIIENDRTKKNEDGTIEKIDSGVRIVVEEGISFLVSDIDGYVTPLQGEYDSQKVGEDEDNLMEIKKSDIKGKLIVTKEIDLKVVGPDTGNITTFGDVNATGVTGGYSVEANGVHVTGDVRGVVVAKGKLVVDGSVTGGQHTKTEGNGVKIINDGRLFSLEGNITVKGNVFFRSHIEALKGLVDLQNVEASTVIGKKIKIKNARKSIFIGEDIEAEGCNDCLFIITNSMNVNSLQLSQNHENVVFVLNPPNYEEEYENCSKQIDEITQKIENLGKVVEQLTKENRMITTYAGILNKFIKDKKNLTENEGKILKQYQDWYLKNKGNKDENDKKINKASELIASVTADLEKLNRDFHKLGELRGKQVTPKVNIKMNTGALKILGLEFSPYKQIEDFSDEDIVKLTNIRDLLGKKNYSYNTLASIPGGTVNWEYKAPKK